MRNRDARDTPVALPLGLALAVFIIPTAFAFDPLDPSGNITVMWDVIAWRDDITGFDAKVTIFNNQLYRHIETPGWKLSWNWTHDEVIWYMAGAEATEQGNCSRIRAAQLPHSCEKRPVIIDLLPGTQYNIQTANCCRGGVLSSLRQNPSKSVSSFQLTVGNIFVNTSSVNDTVSANDTRSVPVVIPDFEPPSNLSFGVPGYTCGTLGKVAPTKFPTDGGRRNTQALVTYRSTCSYSQMVAKSVPTCCVSLSTFYNETIVGCPYCSCGCQGPQGSPSQMHCIKEGEQPSVLQLPQGDALAVEDAEQTPVVRCTSHLCPIAVHWHVKTNYREYWRVKMTVTNFNVFKNYSEWNLVVQHPNLEKVTQVFSFNYQPLNIYPGNNDSGIFWGIQYYNDMLLQYGESGNVQSEMLLQKRTDRFTFRAGWAFPRRIYFNGDLCVMPPPDLYPRMPNSSPETPINSIPYYWSLVLLTLVLMLG